MIHHPDESPEEGGMIAKYLTGVRNPPRTRFGCVLMGVGERVWPY
jgi:hypothetical protein